MLNFSKIIAGTMTWGQWGKSLDTNDMSSLIKHCLDCGITTFDHADIYGGYTTEAEFGKAFKKSAVSRADIQLITKCGIQYESENRNNKIKHYNYTKDYIIWSVETSLKHLQTDYLDALLLHRPSPLLDPEDVAKAFSILKQDGKVLQFGVSNFTTWQLMVLQKHIPIHINQIECSLTNYKPLHDGVLDYMMVHNIQPMAWSPLGSFFKEKNAQTERIDKVLVVLCEKYNVSKDQLLLAFMMTHPCQIIPVVGTTNKKRLIDATKAVDINLKIEDWFTLLVASQGHKVP